MIDVRMLPSPDMLGAGESGIHTVVRQYARYFPEFGVNLVTSDEADYDLLAVHAGMYPLRPNVRPMVSILHGLYWTAHYQSSNWEFRANASVINSIRHAQQVTVPSAWVAETFQRDMRFSPHVVPHGVDWQAFQHKLEPEPFILGYAKNRVGDVCDPSYLSDLADAFQDTKIVSTFAPLVTRTNIHVTGVLPYHKMRELTQKASLFISPIEETFGLHALEALAAGTPVLTPDIGGVAEFVQHGINGYLYDPSDITDLIDGVNYCLRNRKTLSNNARELAKEWTWQRAVEKMVNVFKLALQVPSPSVSVVIPCYNKTELQLRKAIDSVRAQTFSANDIVIIDDGSKNGAEIKAIVESYGETGGTKPRYIRQENSTVAVARNHGAAITASKYLCFLDADDAIAPTFLETCVNALESDTSLHLAYTRLHWEKPDGTQGDSAWPAGWDFNAQLRRKNQVPTCNVMRRVTFERLGGYKKRYSVSGAGSEDAELWTRFGAYGYKCGLVSEEFLFLYSWQGGHTSQPGYSEVDWLEMHPWSRDDKHPFASYAEPVNFSHPVRQYNHPDISVIIPLAKHHIRDVTNALDSLDAQTFRNWEVILVKDFDDPEESAQLDRILAPYPYVRMFSTTGKHGAGKARNIGVEHSRGTFLVFLDADDNLYPVALEKMLQGWITYQTIIYTDYVGKVITDTPDVLEQEVSIDPYRRLLYRKGNELVIHHDASREYDCERAIRQPPRNGERPYLWCLVTCLIPKAWHQEIGGYDEEMVSWEDMDYHWRLARRGHCYTRLPEDLVVYRFSTGRRRADGLQNRRDLLEYLIDKYDKLGEPMACGCKGKGGDVNVAERVSDFLNQSGLGTQTSLMTVDRKPMFVEDSDLVDVVYSTNNSGKHLIIGTATRISYGRRAGGERFKMHVKDVYVTGSNGRTVVNPSFQPVNRVQAPKPIRKEAPEPKPIQRFAVPAGKEFTIEDAANIVEESPPPPMPEINWGGGVQQVAGIDDLTTLTAEQISALKLKGISTLQSLIINGEPILAALGGDFQSKSVSIIAEAIRLLSETGNGDDSSN